MANKECLLKASVTERESPDLNSPKTKCFENVEKFERDDSVTYEWKKQNDFDKTSTQGPCKEFLERKSDDLFENVPELKANFVIQSKIGEGTFSDVYLASLVKYPDEKFALKHIIPTSSPDRVEREVRCLQEMGGKNNVIGYKGTIRHCDHNVIILPYFPHDRFQDYLHSMTVSGIQDYIKNLLLALKHIHSFSIIHRDIKPGNFLHCRKSGRYNLVDFGLAMHEPGSENAWDIEKKNGKYSKSSNVKNARQLSPESMSKNSQAPKRPRTSPRVAVTSHKLARQANGVAKSTVKETAKPPVGQNNASKDVETGAKQKNRAVRFVSPSDQKEKLDGKSLPLSSKITTGLCQTKHKTYEICTLCIKRVAQSAPRAGTSGFRAPEVLLKYPHQTTAVDVWSAGIILLCLLSGKYPFFRCGDDMIALAQIITVFGKQRVVESTKHLGKYMVCNSISPGYELKKLCQKLRSAKQKENEESCIKCCTSCSKLLPKNEPTSPASNLRTSLRTSPKTRGVEANKQDVVSTKIGESDSSQSHTVDREKKILQASSLQQNPTNDLLGSVQADILKSSKTKTSENKRNGHVGSHGEVPVITHASKGASKFRSMSEGNKPSSEKANDCSRDQTGSGAIREHLDGSCCTCDCGSCPEYVPASVYNLLERCLDLNPTTRITASEALNHPFLRDRKNLGISAPPER